MDNLAGHQQRSFMVYWCLKGAENGGVGVDMGCGELKHPYCFRVDKYAGSSHPEYPSPHKANYHPHMVLRADKPLPFTDGCFDFLVSSHSLEHMYDTNWTLREWIRIVRKNGFLAVVMPDATYGKTSDEEHHQVSWKAKDFKKEVLIPLVDEGVIKIMEFDSFQNHFSFNFVVRKLV